MKGEKGYREVGSWDEESMAKNSGECQAPVFTRYCDETVETPLSPFLIMPIVANDLFRPVALDLHFMQWASDGPPGLL
jgi:hypothetical protein